MFFGTQCTYVHIIRVAQIKYDIRYDTIVEFIGLTYVESVYVQDSSESAGGGLRLRNRSSCCR